MLTTSISEFRKNTKKYLDNVTDDAETLIINRGSEKAVVILSLNEYNSMNATLHELSSKANEIRLDKAIKQIEAGKVVYKDLIEK